MADCCIIGCDNKAEKRGEIKFYLLPTARSSKPSKVKRRLLWIEAIEKANGTTEGLSDDHAQICGAHFVSGQMSLDASDQDFVPSVFPKEHTSKSRRQTLRPRPGVLTENPKVTPKRNVESKRNSASGKINNYNNINENNYCEPLEDEEILEEEETTQPSRNQDKKILKKEETTQPPSSKDEGMLKEEKTTPPLASSQVKTEYIKLKRLKLQIKSIVDHFDMFQCEVCNGKFPTSSGLVKHKRLHEQEWSDEDENLSTSSDSVVKSEFVDKPVTIEEPSFQCNMCNRSFPTIHSLKRHKLLHVHDSRKCTQCGTMFCKRHNHVVAQPQISTETHFEESETTTDNTEETAECHMFNLSGCDGADEDLELLLNSNSATLDAIAAAQKQSESPADTLHKEAPTITYNPRKPGLLMAFKSFLNKHTPENLKIKKQEDNFCTPTSEKNQPTATCTNAIDVTTITTSTPINASINAPNTTTANPVTVLITSTAAPIITTSTSAMTSKPVPETSSKTVPLTTSTNAPQMGKPILCVTKSNQQPSEQSFQKMEQSTVCLSFSKPLPSNVIQEFMTYISQRESLKSQSPRLVTFTAKQDQLLDKQDTNEIASIVKLEQSEPSVPTLPERSNKDKTTFIITTMPKLKTPPPILPTSTFKTPPPILPKLNLNTTPPIVKPPSQKPQLPLQSPILKAHKRPYVHGSRPPSPEPIFAKVKKGPWNPQIPNYPKNFVQPHLPQTPVLPPELQMFSPQFLTSSLLDVERNFEYILSDIFL